MNPNHDPLDLIIVPEEFINGGEILLVSSLPFLFLLVIKQLLFNRLCGKVEGVEHVALALAFLRQRLSTNRAPLCG